MTLFRTGETGQALELIRRAITLKPDYADAYNSLGNILMDQNAPEQAYRSYLSALELVPQHPQALLNIARSQEMMGDYEGALQSLHKLSVIYPERPDTLIMGGSILLKARDAAAAAATFEAAIQLDPNRAETHNWLGLSLVELSQLSGAKKAFRMAISLDAANALYWNNLGNVLMDLDDVNGALGAYEHALAIDPRASNVLSNIANVYNLMNEPIKALDFCQKALEIDPSHTGALNNRGNACQLMGNYPQAEQSFRDALAINGLDAEIMHNLAKVLEKQDRLPEATSRCLEALELDPGNYEISYTLGNLYRARFRFKEAERAYTRAISQAPDNPAPYLNLGNVLKETGRIDEALAILQKIIEMDPENTAAHSNYLYYMNYSSRVTVEDIFRESLKWDRRFAPDEGGYAEFSNQLDPDRQLKIGYVSPDFCAHPVGYFTLPVITRHDSKMFRVYCYAENGKEDDLTHRLKDAADQWKSTVSLSDEQLYNEIRDDGIDILVDLAGHTANNRLRVFAMKPAPIQVTWAGYVGTTGLKAMDYLISDRFETPEGDDRFCSERIVRMPHDYICYEPVSYAPAVGPAPMIANGYPTFGCCNNISKITPEVVALWSEILQAVPESRLLLITSSLDDDYTQSRYREMFASYMTDGRVSFYGRQSHRDLLGKYNEIDIALDPFPYSGGLTTIECLWMGVPVITLGGDRFASRHSISHLTNAGLQELIASSPPEYIEKAVALAKDRTRIETIRNGLRDKMRRSPLCDGLGFTAALEKVYRTIWREWCASISSARATTVGAG